MSLAIGSILNATTEQFETRYKIMKPKDRTKNEFVQTFQSLQKMACQDARECKSNGVSQKEIGEKLYKIVSSAIQAHDSLIKSKRSDTGYKSLLLSSPPIEINADGRFQVSGLDACAMMIEECSFCDKEIRSPRNFTIINKDTRTKLRVPELTLHFLTAHDYYGRPGDYRVDPAQASKVLNLVKETSGKETSLLKEMDTETDF